jgi:hypothetical protein
LPRVNVFDASESHAARTSTNGTADRTRALLMNWMTGVQELRAATKSAEAILAPAPGTQNLERGTRNDTNLEPRTTGTWNPERGTWNFGFFSVSQIRSLA